MKPMEHLKVNVKIVAAVGKHAFSAIVVRSTKMKVRLLTTSIYAKRTKVQFPVINILNPRLKRSIPILHSDIFLIVST